ncbi:hypothetical protein BST45_05285 [Mycobacterium shinjukuense]|uniref:Uncharacterized protein n=1 Tax=Mycobacterium shinjukuense TaxID=398694 RepID=A0A7I7MS53_9MYCO|nr:hypothetical protein BST45_05285 [Mycobacterium shinjukuense]BBX75015.1 hypothetical protein MSHI_29210 [Mycobacterium shinjukuense]
MTVRQHDTTSHSPRRPIPRGAFRPDIEGLRAVSVPAAVRYHAGIPGAGGGHIGVEVSSSRAAGSGARRPGRSRPVGRMNLAQMNLMTTTNVVRIKEFWRF